MACGDATCFPNFYSQLSKFSVFLSLSFEPNCDSFEDFNEFMLAPHQKTNCTLTDCMFHVLIIDDQLFHNFPKNIPLREFYYQSVDCLLTVSLNYFRVISNSQGDTIQDLCKAADFHRSLTYKVLKRPSVKKKRLLRKRFKFFRSKLLPGCSSRSLSLKPQYLTSHFIYKVESILNSESGKFFYNLVTLLSEQKLSLDTTTSQIPTIVENGPAIEL